MGGFPLGHDFRARLRRGETLLGTLVTLPTPATAEVLAGLGFDWLFIDGEHAALDIRDVLSILQTVGHRLAALVRVRSADEAAIKQALDLGAAGIIVPQVNSAEQAAEVVRWSRYAPQGARSVGLARAHGYGLRFQEYVDVANEQVAVIVQAEHIDAVEGIEAIVRVPGVDAVQIGPYDLSASLGKMGQIQDPEVTSAIDRIIEACQAVAMPVGWFAATAAGAQSYMARGCTLITAGVDTLMLGGAAKDLLAALRCAS